MALFIECIGLPSTIYNGSSLELTVFIPPIFTPETFFDTPELEVILTPAICPCNALAIDC